MGGNDGRNIHYDRYYCCGYDYWGLYLDKTKQMRRKCIVITDLIFTGLMMLLGREGRDWIYYETDPDWWSLRLWTRRN